MAVLLVQRVVRLRGSGVSSSSRCDDVCPGDRVVLGPVIVVGNGLLGEIFTDLRLPQYHGILL